MHVSRWLDADRTTRETPARRRAIHLTVRVTAAEADTAYSVARQQGRIVGAIVREVLRQYCDDDERGSCELLQHGGPRVERGGRS